MDGASPTTADLAHCTAARPHTSHRVPPIQQQQGMGTGTSTTEEPTLETWRVCMGTTPAFRRPHGLCNVDADSAVTRVIHAYTAPSLAPTSYVSANF